MSTERKGVVCEYCECNHGTDMPCLKRVAEMLIYHRTIGLTRADNNFYTHVRNKFIIRHETLVVEWLEEQEWEGFADKVSDKVSDTDPNI